MILKRLFSLAVLTTASMACSISSASYFTSNGTLQLRNLAGTQSTTSPPVIHITRFGFTEGQLWTNQATPSPSTPAAFIPGNTVRTVGAFTLGGVTNGSPLFVGAPTSPIPDTIVGIFAVEGVITGLGEARFSGGSLFLTAAETGNPTLPYSIVNPLSWNFENAFAKFDILPPDDIVDGSTVGIPPTVTGGGPAAPVQVRSTLPLQP